MSSLVEQKGEVNGTERRNMRLNFIDALPIPLFLLIG